MVAMVESTSNYWCHYSVNLIVSGMKQLVVSLFDNKAFGCDASQRQRRSNTQLVCLMGYLMQTSKLSRRELLNWWGLGKHVFLSSA